jgi:hypothetical protein
VRIFLKIWHYFFQYLNSFVALLYVYRSVRLMLMRKRFGNIIPNLFVGCDRDASPTLFLSQSHRARRKKVVNHAIVCVSVVCVRENGARSEPFERISFVLRFTL